MVDSNYCLKSGQIFVDWIVPEGILHRRQCLGDFYRAHPVLSRLIVTPLAVISGVAKVILFPFVCLIGIVVLPIIAVILACKEKKSAGNWLGAWVFCILGAAGSVAFLGLSFYYLPLVVSSALFIALVSTSIILHVYKFVREPEHKQIVDMRN